MEYLARQSQQSEAIAAAMHRLADVAEKAVADSKPAMQFFGDASRRLDALCRWLQKWGPWILGLIPVAASIVGIITPNMAVRLDALLKLFHG